MSLAHCKIGWTSAEGNLTLSGRPLLRVRRFRAVPTAYMTAYYSLVMRGRLRRGMRVLIHSGTGAVGLAAIQICLTRGAEVGCSDCYLSLLS